MNSNLFFIQLNEINFEIVEKYISRSNNKFKNLKLIFNEYKYFLTNSENEYKNLEPWIQWPSIYLGKNFKEHKIFRLGDIINHPDKKQIFEILEDEGLSVGAISPMNAENRLKKPAYFISDPWTNTRSDKSGFSKRLSSMLRQTVNDNASGGLTFSSIITIIEIVLKTINLKQTPFLFKLILSSFVKPWKKSLVLDYLIHLTHLHLLKKKKPNFSSVFFNAGAHIQHHYFYNTKHLKDLPKNPKWYIDSSSDPIEDMLAIYDHIIGDYLNFYKPSHKLLIATGLRQVPYNKAKFYYRLKNHNLFLKKIGIKYLKILPRMTRDFEIIFETDEDLKSAKNILQNIKCKSNNLNIFNEIEERRKSLFLTLTYPNEVKKDDVLSVDNKLELNFASQIVFVAIKNGMHDSKGYVFCSQNVNFEIPNDPIHISKLQKIIINNLIKN